MSEGSVMNSSYSNVYADETRAVSYADLGFPATYYLAFRDIPSILDRHITGKQALDFGCGAGRSTRFLRELGFNVLGVDIAECMLHKARIRDPGGTYRLIPDGDFSGLEIGGYDLVLCAFTFDNIPDRQKRLRLFAGLGGLLRKGGRIVNLVSSPDIYIHEWASFSTKQFPENRDATSGGKVKIVMLDVEDRRPVEDVLWTDEDYRDIYREAGLDLLEVHRPIGNPSEPFDWVTETEVAPWTIYLLGHRDVNGVENP